jgi:general secretion pathway protein A
MLDPSFESRSLFTHSLVKNFGIPMETGSGQPTLTDLREALERFLFQKGVVENKTVILIIDEAQKLDPMSMEVLRLLLNYETNQFKLLQLVLLGQTELLTSIQQIPNFMDRISFKTKLDPLGFEEMKEMIFFRIEQAGYRSKMDLFLEDALNDVYQFTKGYPRQVTMLCHKALKTMLMRNKAVVDRELINEIMEEEAQFGWQRTNRLLQNSSF